MATLYLYERLIAAAAAPIELPPDLELTVWDSPDRISDPGRGLHPEAVERLSNGQACAVARHGAEIVAYCWVTRAPVWVGEIRRILVPGPEDVYVYDAFTAPAWRGRKLFPALIHESLIWAGARGSRRALVFVLSRNRSSQRAVERAGFERFAAVSRLSRLGLERLWMRGRRAARAGLTLVVPEARPTSEPGPAGRGAQRQVPDALGERSGPGRRQGTTSP